MKNPIFLIAGVIGAAEISALSILMAQQATRNMGLLTFFITIPIGAFLGVKVMQLFVSDEGLDNDSVYSATGISSLVGCLPSWMFVMTVAFAPLEIGICVLSVVPAILCLALLARSLKKKY